MDIRRARPDDAPKITEIEASCFSDPWSLKDVFSYVCSEDGMCFVATDEGQVVAYVIGRVIPPEGEIYRIAVSPERRRRGVGYRLLSYALKTERGRGLETVFLEVRMRNAAARALYLAHGFKQIGMRRGYYKNPDDDAAIMVLEKA